MVTAGEHPNPDILGSTLLLRDVRVVSLTHMLQGPLGAQLLADLGADVVKIEHVEGGQERYWAGADTFLNGESAFFLLTHRNQRSLAVDLKHPQGLEVVRRLIDRADVVIENFRQGVLDRIGLGYETVSKTNPRIVYCSCSGFGPLGPDRERTGQDLLLQALSGLAANTGRADAPPTPVGSSIVDTHSGVLAAFGILAALFDRERSGRGHRVDVSLLNASIDLQTEAFGYFVNGGKLAPRSATGIATVFHEAPYGIYPTTDGWLALSQTTITVLAEVTGDATLATFRDDEQFSNREVINAEIVRVLKTRTTRDWLELFEKNGVWCCEVNDYQKLHDDPQVKAMGIVQEFDHPRAGRVRYLAHPVQYDGRSPSLRLRPPLLGEHSEEILAELGFDQDARAAIIASGAVAVASPSKDGAS